MSAVVQPLVEQITTEPGGPQAQGARALEIKSLIGLSQEQWQEVTLGLPRAVQSAIAAMQEQRQAGLSVFLHP